MKYIYIYLFLSTLILFYIKEMKIFCFHMKWPHGKSNLLSVFIIMTFLIITTKSENECPNVDCISKLSETKTCFGEAQTCLNLICYEVTTKWKINNLDLAIPNCGNFSEK